MAAKLLHILTGINRPAAPSSGSMILAHDLYGAMPDVHSTFLGQAPVDQAWKAAFDQLITLSTVKRPHGPDFGPYLDELTREVGALIGKIQPDAIHAQYCGFALSVAFARSAGTIPIIAIAHGTDVIMAERSALERECLTEVAAAAAMIVAPNVTLAQHIDALTGHRHTDRLTVIPWGIPLRHTKTPRRAHGGTGPMALLHAGRLDENKSTKTVIEALALADQPHHLTVIGNGPELDHLITTAHDLGVADRVTFEPFTPRDQLWQRFADFDAFVFSTAELEACGLVAIEAQAHRLTVVYSDLPGMSETLGHAGTPYTPRDPGALAAALDHLARDPRWRNALARAGRNNALRYDITTTARKLTDLTACAVRAARA